MATPSCEVHFLDVGQGHATLITDTEHALLVDCPYSGSSAVLDKLSEIGDSVELDAIVTHRDLDHCAGLRKVMQERPLNTLYINFAWAMAPSGRAGSRIRSVIRGLRDQAELDRTEPLPIVEGLREGRGLIEWEVLSPPYMWVWDAALADTTNRSSVVVLISVLGYKVLIPGDADEKALARLVKSGRDLSAQVLLVPHHGADIPGLGDFVDAVDPELAVISAGRSAKIHPTVRTLDLLAAKGGCRVTCTQVAGACHSLGLQDAACAGTVTCLVTQSGVTVEPDGLAHRSRIAGLASPRCV